MRTKRAVRIAVFAVIILIIFCFIPRGPVEADSGYRQIMGTFARVVVIAADKSKALKSMDAAFEQLQQVEKLMNVHDPNSQLSYVNRLADEKPVKVDERLFSILERSVYYGKITDGAFDITVGPLVDLWRKSGDSNAPPTAEEIEKIRSKVGYQKLFLDSNDMSVSFGIEGMKIDLGGIAKGYSVDKALEAAKAAGARGVMIDVGGNISCFGITIDKKPYWLVGLQDPNIADDLLTNHQSLLTLKLSDQSVATSGDYRRFITIDGKKHSHIIDTGTGQSSEQLSSVTIITKNAVDADALSTAVSVLGQKKGLELINSLTDTEAVLITSGPEYKLIMTEGTQRYIYKH